MKKEQWSADWPEVGGWYWFYGQEFGVGKPKLVPVEVRGPVSNSAGGESYLYTAGSHFLYPSEAIGLWSHLVLPELPTLS